MKFRVIRFIFAEPYFKTAFNTPLKRYTNPVHLNPKIFYRYPELLRQFTAMIDLSLLFFGEILHNQLPILSAKFLQTRTQTFLYIFGAIFIALDCCWLPQFGPF